MSDKEKNLLNSGDYSGIKLDYMNQKPVNYNLNASIDSGA